MRKRATDLDSNPTHDIIVIIIQQHPTSSNPFKGSFFIII